MKETHVFPEFDIDRPAYLSSTYGGEIYESDFCTDHGSKASGKSVMASRIVSAWRFDLQCVRNSEIREYKKKRGELNNNNAVFTY